MKRVLFLFAAVLLLGGMATSANGQAVPLDISGGFNFDIWCGALEFQALMDHAAANWGIDLIQMQGNYDEGNGPQYLLGNASWLVGDSTESGFGETYSISTNWWHPSYVTGTQGTP